MASNASVTACPAPFIAELSIGDNGGYLDGRWCQPYRVGDEVVSCCFPCPFTDWRYSDDFNADIVPWIGLAVLVLMIISGLTYIVLPTSDTQRHYLTSSPLMGFIFMSIAFIIPLGPSVEYCHDAITPNYWLSDNSCAASGSLILYGVWVLVIGCFFRSLSLYLQVRWDIEPGNRFRTIALTCIFAGSLAMLGIALGVSGVSYQVGKMCYTSYPHSIAAFWGPLIGLASISFLLQMVIMVYCIAGVITRGGTARFSIFNLKRSRNSSVGDDGLPRDALVPSGYTSFRIRRILQLQWRAIAIAVLVLLYVAYVGQAVMRFRDPKGYDYEKLAPWMECLVRVKGDHRACKEYASIIQPNQATAVSALALLASGGFWGMVCTIRWTMILGWFDWARDRRDAVSDLVHGRERRERPTDLERVSSDANCTAVQVQLHSPTTLQDIDRLCETRTYHKPANSFSVPRRTGTVAVGERTFTGSTVTTLITSENAYEMKDLK
ncbi:hypothetical protein BJX99DRAFT_104714 [Aspergillus californicus]